MSQTVSALPELVTPGDMTKTSVETKEWKPNKGQARLYVQNWPELVGLTVAYYKTGNVCHATLNGQSVSNAEAGRILAAKVWIGVEDDEVHVEGCCGRKVTGQDIRKAVEAAR